MTSGTGRIPNKCSAAVILNLFKGLHMQPGLGKCVFSLPVTSFIGLGLSPPGTGGTGGVGFGKLSSLSPSGDWVSGKVSPAIMPP